MGKMICADSRDALADIGEGTVHCCITSPPYWGLRDYGCPEAIFGGDAGCEHVWGDEQFAKAQGDTKSGFNARYFGKDIAPGKQAETALHKLGTSTPQGQICQLCGAWRGQLGLEPNPEMYVDHLLEYLRAIWRVLRNDGVLWLNLGDSYSAASTHKGGNKMGPLDSKASLKGFKGATTQFSDGLAGKQLLMIPFRMALAAQADGWWIRSAIPWIKRNPMPSSVKDRPTTSHEYVFLMTKNKRYFYDSDAIKTPLQTVASENYPARAKILGRGKQAGHGQHPSGPQQDSSGGYPPSGVGRNRRTADFFFDSLQYILDKGQGMLQDEEGEAPIALVVNTRGYKGAHFATFPPDLVRPMILTTPTKVCAGCGKGWERVTERGESTYGRIQREQGVSWRDMQTISEQRGTALKGGQPACGGTRTATGAAPHLEAASIQTLGFRPTCSCYNDLYRTEFPKSPNARKRYQRDASGDWFKRARKRPGKDHWETSLATILDPFSGRGTTLREAREANRDWIGVDVDQKSIDLAMEWMGMNPVETKVRDKTWVQPRLDPL